MCLQRDDIVINHQRKISGTAAKLGRTAAYHHCTLLVSVDTSNLSRALNNPHSDIFLTNATKSIRSPVENLASNFQHENLTEEIERSIAAEFSSVDIIDIEPTEENYPGLDKIISGYQSWNWIFGKSPKFDIIVGDLKLTVMHGMLNLSDQQFSFDSHLLEHLCKSAQSNHQMLARLLKDIL